jgi:hypothetical protein
MLGAAVLGFAGDASAEPEGSGSGTVIHMCLCRGSCKLVTHCLLNYCYSETICDDCLSQADVTGDESTGWIQKNMRVP